MKRAKHTQKEDRFRLLQTTGLRMMILALPASLAPAAMAQEAQTPLADREASDVVIVSGHRLSTEKAIEEQKNAKGVVSVLSTDDLGKLPDANVADALARVPGVNVVVNQDTGEGEFVTVRGFAGTYNSYSINGVRVATADPDSRQVSMTVLPPNGLQAISVSKTLTPDLDGDAIGGAVDFRTPTAFDFSDSVLRAFLTYGVNSRAKDTGVDDDTTGAEFQYGSRFGVNEDWGVFAAVNYANSHGANEETENDGEWEPYRFRLNAQEPIDERSLYLPGVDLDYRRNEQERIGGNFSVDYHGETQELYVKGQYATFKRTSTNDWTDFRTRPAPRLEQININSTALLQPEQSIAGFDPVKGRVYNYTTAQIRDADGDGIITDRDRVRSSYWSLYGRSGVWDPQQMQFSRNMDVNDQNQILATINTGGATELGALELTYDLSYSYGEKENPDNFFVGYNCDRCGVLGQNGVLWSSYDPRFPLPQLPPPVADVEHRDDYLAFDGASHSRSRQSDQRFAGKIDATWEMEGPLDFVKAGAKVLRSKRKFDNTPLFEGDLLGAAATTLDQSGLVERQIPDFLDGRYYFGSIMDRQKVIAAVLAAEAATPGTIDAEDLASDDKWGTETIYAAYGLANFKFDALEVIAGARFEATEVSNTAWNEEPADGAAAAFTTTDSDYSNFLPSVTAIYRPTDNYVFRGAVWTSFSRPEYSNMFAGERVTRNAAGEVVSRQLGSPDLKPADSLNVDFSAEYYPDETSLISAGAFFKKIDNFIFTYGSAVETSTSVGFEEVTQVKNGEDAQIYGVELNLIKEFQELMAPFDGLGVAVNLTLQDSAAETGIPYRVGRPIPFIAAPDMLANTTLSYQKGPFQALLSYNYQGKYIESLRDNAVDKWVQPYQALDFHSRWTFNSNFAMDFDVQNILDGWRYYTTKGDSPSYQKDYMEPGRTFVFKLTYTH